MKSKLLEIYNANQKLIELSFFIGGFILDIFTLSEVNDPISIVQQIVYLLITGTILFYEYKLPVNYYPQNRFIIPLWNYKKLIFHFCLGSLISIYSLYFLISSSFFTSLVFVILLLALLVANEVKFIQESKVNIKLCLYIIVIFCFYSMMWPIALGFVGLLPFMLALVTSLFTIYIAYKALIKNSTDKIEINKKFLYPSTSVLFIFLLFYFLGWIPPVPLSVQDMGIYHHIEKINDEYHIKHEKPWWKFWKEGDQEFIAEPNDEIYFFAKISSPSGFADEIYLHWFTYNERLGWQSTDRVKMSVRGGRSDGYRGFSSKKNFSDGEWRVKVETTDGREIGRIYFVVKKVDQPNPNRVFTVKIE